MQIHELNRKPARPVQGLDTTKVSPHIAAQIAKAKADSQATLSQQAKQAKQAVSAAGTAMPTTPYQVPGNNTNPNPNPTPATPPPANPLGQMASSLRSPPTPAGPVATSTGGTATRTATGTRHTAAAANPNVAAPPAAQPAAVADNPSITTPKKAAPATGWSRIGAIGKALATGAGHGIAAAAGIDPMTGKAASSPSYQYRSQPGAAPAAGTPQATLLAKLAPTGITQKGLAAAGQVLQQLGNGNRTLKKTGDRNVDAVLSSMGYTLQ